jgi:3-hydroxyisobutyrate dehydrogenase-like beta-hydroxyacid dehydrogenase
MSDIAVAGLGAMGSALARTLIEGGRHVTVWNRSPEKMEPLVALGAQPASSFAEALASSPRLIVCLLDYESTAELVEQAEILPLLDGRTVIQLTTATPKEASTSEAWFHQHGASYLDGAILCWPGNIGTPSGQIAVSGLESVFAECQADLDHLAGDLRYLGSNIRAAATLDLAFLSRTLGIIFGSIHGALVCEAEGVSVAEFTAILPAGDRAIPLTEAINDGSFDTITAAGASVDVAGSAVRRMQQQAHDAGISSELPDLLCSWVERAQAAGYGSQETAAVIKAIRGATP